MAESVLPLPPDWADGPGPLHQRLRQAIDRLVRTGELAPGSALPTERDLAARIAVSRSTVAQAYRRLKADGRIDSRQGRGTWVSEASGPVAAPAELLAPLLASDAEVIDLALAVPAPATPLALSAGVASGTGYEPAGLPALRAAIAARYSARGLPTDASQILLTHGAQHALALVMAHHLGPGDTAVVESSTYVGALDLARSLGAHVAPVAMDERGLDVDDLEAVVERRRPRLAYLNPTHHSPTGTTLALDRRRRVVARAARAELPLVDDATLADLAFDPAATPPLLAAIDRRVPVITVGSLSKVVWAGLRVGWIRAHPDLVEVLVAERMVGDLGGSLPAQVAALHLVDHLDDLLAARREDLRRCHDHLLGALRDNLPDWTVDPATGGTSLWVRLPDGVAATVVSTVAAAHGVAVVAGPTVSPHDAAADRIRLSFVQPRARLDEAVRRLALAWAEVGRPGRRPRVLV